MNDQRFFDRVAALTALAVLTGGLALLGLPAGTPPPAAPTTATTVVHLTIALNATTGWPQYSPAHLTVPEGRLVVVITDQDAPMAWAACSCRVTGTVGGNETVNHTPFTQVDPGNVAHTFSIPALGLNVLSPGESEVEFTVLLTAPGEFHWLCLAPCGAGDDAYGSPPMGTDGYMSGTLTVV